MLKTFQSGHIRLSSQEEDEEEDQQLDIMASSDGPVSPSIQTNETNTHLTGSFSMRPNPKGNSLENDGELEFNMSIEEGRKREKKAVLETQANMLFLVYKLLIYLMFFWNIGWLVTIFCFYFTYKIFSYPEAFYFVIGGKASVPGAPLSFVFHVAASWLTFRPVKDTNKLSALNSVTMSQHHDNATVSVVIWSCLKLVHVAALNMVAPAGTKEAFEMILLWGVAAGVWGLSKKIKEILEVSNLYDR